MAWLGALVLLLFQTGDSIWRGLSYAEGGLRMRYEIVEHLAPYVGFSWSRDLGRTADFDRAAGLDPEAKNVVVGVRSEF